MNRPLFDLNGRCVHKGDIVRFMPYPNDLLLTGKVVDIDSDRIASILSSGEFEEGMVYFAKTVEKI